MTQSFLTPVYGVIQNISQSPNQCCDSLITLLTSNGLIRFAAGPDTFIIDSARLSPGMSVAAFYDPSLPVPLRTASPPMTPRLRSPLFSKWSAPSPSALTRWC